ncbi:hypothetical protein FOYG_09207 [Fusarium oxysporum NRRL 32931]|uniref:Uncharacterized protein n=1 Tax=Fusarium oxysporum NRRL 32931 TaxID=660029 RepID=W9I3G8_FUSOX|nr:hypothetical protein FOYG_09207 [Fusarium oxysporum NRRL 32931]EWZ81922.1 hypothetical protein FOWG_14344 [Fusarium oxysporum f. sp. lycopersici MN25]
MSFEAVTDLAVEHLTGVGHLVILAKKAAKAFTPLSRSRYIKMPYWKLE